MNVLEGGTGQLSPGAAATPPPTDSVCDVIVLYGVLEVVTNLVV